MPVCERCLDDYDEDDSEALDPSTYCSPECEDDDEDEYLDEDDE